MFTLEGRVAVVTGASGSISRAIIRSLTAGGMKVAVCTHGIWMAEQTIKDLGEDVAKNCIPVACETGDPKDMKEKFAYIAEKLGGIDVLITMHGRSMEYREQNFDTLEPDYVDLTISNHLTGSYNLLREAIPYLENSKAGRVIFAANTYALTGAENDAMGVTMAKGGTIALTYSAARRLAPKGITVNCIAIGGVMNMPVAGGPPPGAIHGGPDHHGPGGPGDKRHGGPSGPGGKGPGAPSWIKPEELIDPATIPVGRVGRPEDIAAAVCYLASEEAGFVTGDVLNVSGGMFIG